MQVAIVTGSGIRVGKAIAEKLAAHNYHVICHGNQSFEAVKQLAISIQENGGSAEAVQADLAEIEGVRRLGQTIVERYSELSLLVNNAGVYENCAFADITLGAYRKMQAINLDAPFFLSQALLPALRKAKGTIVNITDSSVARAYANHSHYFVSKAVLYCLDFQYFREFVLLTHGQSNRRRPTDHFPMIVSPAPGDQCYHSHLHLILVGDFFHFLRLYPE